MPVLDQKAVADIFATAKDQGEALIALYRLVFPQWDRIQKLYGYPAVNDSTWRFIARQFIDFDQKHHPNVFAGGIWINQGFTTYRGRRKLADMEVSLKGVCVEF